jgi:hypothetical protein
MSNKRITDLTELTTPTTDDVFPVVDIATNTTTKVQLANLPVQTAVTTALATKQATLVSGTNIKTVNSTTLLGSGDIAVQPTLVSGTSIKTVNSNSLLGAGDVAVQETLVSGTNIKTLNSVSLLGAGNIVLAATPSGVSGAIQFSNGSAFASDAANLFWDDTNNRLGIGTNTPTTDAQIAKNANATTGLLVSNSDTTNISSRASVSVNSGGVIGQLVAISGNDVYMGALASSVRIGANGGTDILITTAGNISMGTASNLGARVGIRGSGSTSATTSLLVQNSAGTEMMRMGDAGYFFAGNSSANTYIINDPSDAGYFATQGPIFLQNGGTTSVAIIGQRMSIGKGSSYADASSTLELSSTTRGFLPPRMTTTQKNAIASPAAGLVVYDSTTNKLCCYNGSTWNDLF